MGLTFARALLLETSFATPFATPLRVPRTALARSTSDDAAQEGASTALADGFLAWGGLPLESLKTTDGYLPEPPFASLSTFLKANVPPLTRQ